MATCRTRINLGNKTAVKTSKPINKAQMLEKVEHYLIYVKRFSKTSIIGIMSVMMYLLNHYDISVINADKAREVEEDYNTRGCKPGTIKHVLESLEYLAACQGIVNDDGTPLKFPKPKMVRKEVKSLTVFEARLLLESTCNTRDRAIIALLLYTGVRSKELLALDIGDIDTKNRIIHVRAHEDIVKNYHERTCVLSRECVSILEEWLNIRPINTGDMALFLNTFGQRLTRGSIHRIVSFTGKRAGIEKHVYTHLLRHTAASTMIHSGIPITECALQLGHRSLASTMIYLHGDIDVLRENIDKKFTY